MEVVLKLIFEGQVGVNCVRVGRNIPYHEESKCYGPVAGGNKVRPGNRKKAMCLSSEKEGVGDDAR